jgi:hypothetical protein|tara:strand:+ start:129 stop:809 length:681 start_codon:yes stop_codon:yes gene_type:complete
MKVAITGHTSGIGECIKDVLELTSGNGQEELELKCYSRSNGWNLAESNGRALLQDILEFSPDIFFNNAWHPDVQNMLCEKLHKKWSDTNKVIVNTGSITAYVPHSVLDENNVYAQNKKALKDYCLLESFKYPYENSCQLINFSWGFVETGLIGRNDVSKEALIDPVEAATIMIEHAERAFQNKDNFSQPEVVINSLYMSKEEQGNTFSTAARGIAKHLIKTRKLSK